MEQTELVNKIDALAKDEEYMKHLLSLGSVEEMSKDLEKHDVDISPEELRRFYTLAKKKEAGELSDKELEEIAGGCLWMPFVGIGIAIVTGGVISTCQD